MELHEAVKIARRCANFSTYRWDEEKIQDWVSVLVRWDRDITLKVLESHVLAKKLDNLADLRETYNGLAKRAQENTPQLERGRPGEDEMVRVRDMLGQFRRGHPLIWPKGEPTSPGSAPRMAQEPRRAPEDSGRAF
jgi:hypothetical protein